MWLLAKLQLHWLSFPSKPKPYIFSSSYTSEEVIYGDYNVNVVILKIC